MHKSSDEKHKKETKEKVRRVNWIALEFGGYINYLLIKLDNMS